MDTTPINLRIHANALVHSGAEIGRDVEIGPYCTIGPNVVLEEGVRLMSHVVVDGHTTIGAHTHAHPCTTTSAAHAYADEPAGANTGVDHDSHSSDHNTTHLPWSGSWGLLLVRGTGKCLV